MKTELASYIETALWSSTDNADDSGGEPLDANYSADDLAPETLEQMSKDVQAFFDAAQAKGLARYGFATMAHYFWLTRNRHGAGFCDGDYPEPDASALTELAHSFGEVDLYIGDDGKIYHG